MVFVNRTSIKGCVHINRRNVIVGLDVGTSSIKAALGEVLYGSGINVRGLVKVPSMGLRKGNIIDLESTARAINTCLGELERLTGIEISSANAGFSSISISSVDSHAVVSIGNPEYEISKEDQKRVLQSAQNVALSPEKNIVQLIERQYIVDGYDGVTDPVGMVGTRLEAEVLLIIAATAALQNLQRSASRINLHLDSLIYNPLLVAEAVLYQTEKEMGVVLVDMGGETTEISVFEKGTLAYSSVIPVGGDYITRDLAFVLKTSIEEAVRIKETNGIASSELASDDLMIDIHNLKGSDTRQVSQLFVADIISARVIEIVEMLRAEIDQFYSRESLVTGMVLTGGGAQLKGLAGVMEKLLGINVRLGLPENVNAMSEEFNQSQNAVVLGALLHGFKNIDNKIIESNHGLTGVLNRINYWLRDLFA